MYPYHNKIKQRIAAGELIGHEWRTDHIRTAREQTHLGIWIL